MKYISFHHCLWSNCDITGRALIKDAEHPGPSTGADYIPQQSWTRFDHQ